MASFHLSTCIWDRAAEFGERTAIIDDSGSYTYADLLAASQSIASALLDRQCGSEEPVVYIANPGFQTVAIQWGIWRAGGIAVPLGTMHPRSEWLYVLSDTQPRFCIYSADFADQILANDGWPENCQRLAAAEMSASTDRALPAGDIQRAAMILYTSGTTSRPKGVVLSHRNLNAQIDCLIEAWGWTADDHILHVLPLHHVHGLVNALACPLSSGAICEFMRFDASEIWHRWVRDEGPNLFMAVPTIYAKLVTAWEEADSKTQARWSAAAETNFRLMVSGSAALPVSVLEKWERITAQRLLERYGMTEIGMALSNPLLGERVAGCVGKPLPAVELRLVDENSLADPADENPGEIQVRGPAVFERYWNCKEATEAAFTSDGWFKTGDVATCTNGVYKILGRNSVDIIKTGGYKVSALEIEEVLRRHEAINNCAVVGVADETWGEIVAVAAVCNQKLELDELRDWSAELLAPYKTPRRMMVVDQLPTNAMGKVTKTDIKKLFEQLS